MVLAVSGHLRTLKGGVEGEAKEGVVEEVAEVGKGMVGSGRAGYGGGQKEEEKEGEKEEEKGQGVEEGVEEGMMERRKEEHRPQIPTTTAARMA